jgi:hypothetical protein
MVRSTTVNPENSYSAGNKKCNGIMSVKVVAALPTRGLIYARTITSMLENGLTEYVIVEGLPIPTSHNTAIKKALALNPTHVFLIEEDIYLPPGTLQRMLAVDAPVVFVNYPVLDTGTGTGTVYSKHGQVWHGPTGCALVKREVFSQMKYPWLETQYSFDARDWKMMNIPNKYGGQDIHWGYKLRKLGIEMKQVTNWQAQHLRCAQLARIENNNGCYDIRRLKPLRNTQ